MNNNIGFRIKQIRNENHLDQEVFSNKLGISKEDLSKIENEEATIHIGILQKLLSNFDIDANWLLTGREKMWLNRQNIGDISDSTVVGVNVCGRKVSINNNMSEKVIAEIFKNHTDIIKQMQEQMDNLVAIISKLNTNDVSGTPH